MFSTGRNQRNTIPMYNPMRTYADYCTEVLQKTEMKRDFEDIKLDFENEIFLKNLHLIPDPLMKNLADTLVTADKPQKVRKQSLETPKMLPKSEVRQESTLAGITNFFSGVFSMLSGAVFRTRSPVPYYDCFDADSRQGSPLSWHRANIDDEDKNGQVPDKLSSDALSSPNGRSDMNINCRSPVTSCEEKLNQVKILLKTPKPSSNPTRLRRRPKKVFVEPGSVEDSFEDAFEPEDFVTLPNDPVLECCSPKQWHSEGLIETDAPKTKIDLGTINETTEIVKDVMDKDAQDSQMDKDTVKNENNTAKLENKDLKIENVDVGNEKDAVNVESDNVKVEISKNAQVSESKSDSDPKQQLVSSCEDKLSKLKALLQEKCKKNTKTNMTPEPIVVHKPPKTIPILKPVDKHFKNPHRMLDKRRKMKMKRTIQDDVCFANEIDANSSVDNSPSTITSSSDASLVDYFDELKGHFKSASTTESEDSFQIVFNDVPKRCRKVSDCDSEDSFIVFEDSPDCFTSNDVFGDDSDSETDVSDSGCSTMTCKLSHSLSRTVSNLTDDTLYESGDEVDCARVEPEVISEGSKGLLLDAHKKSLRKDQPAKKVTFSIHPPKVRVMRVWAFAARQARAGHWERYALDRDRFKRRIADVDMAVSWVLKPQHRSRVMFQRFMPWWNAQRRKEIAEKKEREEERKRLEAERVEEEKRQQEDKLLEESEVLKVQDDMKEVEGIIEEEDRKVDSSRQEDGNTEDRVVKEDLEGNIQNQEDKKLEIKHRKVNIKNVEIENKGRIDTTPTMNNEADSKNNNKIDKRFKNKMDTANTCKLTIVHKIPKDKLDNFERNNKIVNDESSKVINTDKQKKNNMVNANTGNLNEKIDTSCL